MRLPKVAIIGTGGTISGVGRDSLDFYEYSTSGRFMRVDELIATVPELPRVADIVPMAVTNALGTVPGATSLDNTLRVVHGEPHDGWVLLDVEAQGYRRSVGHGQVRLWRPDGVLLGIGSQSCIVRSQGFLPPSAGDVVVSPAV